MTWLKEERKCSQIFIAKALCFWSIKRNKCEMSSNTCPNWKSFLNIHGTLFPDQLFLESEKWRLRENLRDEFIFYPNFSHGPLSVVNGSPPPDETTPVFKRKLCAGEDVSVHQCPSVDISGAKRNWIFRFSSRWARSSPMPAKVLQDTPKHSALFVRLANRPFQFPQEKC